MKHAWNSLPLVVRKEQNIYMSYKRKREEKTVSCPDSTETF